MANRSLDAIGTRFFETEQGTVKIIHPDSKYTKMVGEIEIKNVVKAIVIYEVDCDVSIKIIQRASIDIAQENIEARENIIKTRGGEGKNN